MLRIHKDQIDRYGGSDGIRDVGLLRSALAMPESQFSGVFLHKDVFEMAAAHLFHLSGNHPFFDGNKRVAIVAALVFLYLNGIELQATPEALEEFVMQTAQGKKSKAEMATFFQEQQKT